MGRYWETRPTEAQLLIAVGADGADWLFCDEVLNGEAYGIADCYAASVEAYLAHEVLHVSDAADAYRAALHAHERLEARRPKILCGFAQWEAAVAQSHARLGRAAQAWLDARAEYMGK